MSKITNLHDDIPAHLPEELVEILLQTPQIRIERIVSLGQSSAPGFWYDQTVSECVLLIAGTARLQFESEVIEMKPGSFLNIPAHGRHRIEWTDPDQPTIWLTIHYPTV
jgi:cupin 2 domain-containing protein